MLILLFLSILFLLIMGMEAFSDRMKYGYHYIHSFAVRVMCFGNICKGGVCFSVYSLLDFLFHHCSVMRTMG